MKLLNEELRGLYPNLHWFGNVAPAYGWWQDLIVTEMQVCDLISAWIEVDL